jgi:hypothetical protein
MTKLEELKAAADAARDAAYDDQSSDAWAVYGDAWNAYKAELKKNPVTNLEELKAACDATLTDYEAARAAYDVEYDPYGSAYDAWRAADTLDAAAYAVACAARELLTELN